ncbi:ribonuclease HI family protein [Paenisporosarcina sp. TG-14]|uniref:ribonuclease HI family protein n=1 Tax=Paenisporosarcina sp. TG-14 TaxID=1231057 RepID=UPI0002FCB858|nr:ribonuclease HI family protein [Paenisporosarcina sp. TG-14]
MLEVYIDGASAGNPGPSGIGIYIKGEGHQLRFSEYVGIYDNHTTEFIALVRGLEEAQKLSKEFISVRSDSQVVVAAVEKRYIKNPVYKEFLDQALEIADTFNFFFIKWVNSNSNLTADQLARQALQRKKDS